MICFKKVSKRYTGPFPWILRKLSLTVRQGEFVCILGPSGCGKTTLLNLIAGFIMPSEGTILVNKTPVESPGPDRGVVFQDASLFPWLNVLQNVEFGLKLKGMKGELLNRTAHKYLAGMGMGDHASKYPHTLSGGMRQRVSIARVLALGADLLLMDEPFSALDVETREQLQDEILRVHKLYRKTIVYVTHSIEEAVFLADRILVMTEPDKGLYADIPVNVPRPRNRSSAEFRLIREHLRQNISSPEELMVKDMI